MRRRDHVRANRARFTRGWAGAAVFGLYVASVVSGCATAVDTLEPEAEVAGDGGSGAAAPAGGKSSAAGSKTSAGTSSAGSSGGTKLMGAFGGTASSGGKSSGGASGASSGGGQGGGGGGASQAGSGGRAGSAGAGGKSNGGSASGGSASGGNAGSGGAGMPLACLMSWKGDKCDSCSAQVQSDKAACATILDCYAANACGPASCGGNTDKCGANNIGKGTAGYPIAQDVYDCLCK